MSSTCYRLIDCDDSHPIVSTADSAFASYLGRVVKWIDGAEPGVERCATVEAYVCREETYATPVITIVDCFKTCVECNTVPEAPAEEATTETPAEPAEKTPVVEEAATEAPTEEAPADTPTEAPKEAPAAEATAPAEENKEEEKTNE